ncbi:hypothetical protein ACFE04_011434 [Oxalis oulophora]
MSFLHVILDKNRDPRGNKNSSMGWFLNMLSLIKRLLEVENGEGYTPIKQSSFDTHDRELERDLFQNSQMELLQHPELEGWLDENGRKCFQSRFASILGYRFKMK